jgi:nucleoside-diphosphate-sugar epimerase
MDNTLRISISGASGLLGTFLTKHFVSKGYAVKCHRNKSAIPIELENYQLDWVTGDIRDQYVVKELIKDCDLFIHSAAMVSFEKSDVEKMMSVNVEGTKRVVDNLIGTDIKLIHISSISALGRIDQGKEISEKTTYNHEVKNSAYAQSKYLSELEVHRGIAEGLSAMLLLPSIILGRNNHNSSSSTLWSQILKMPKFAPAGANGFVDVRDVVKATNLCINKWQNGEKFVINGHNLEYIALYDKVVKLKKLKIKPSKISPTFLLCMLPFVKLFYFLTNTNNKISKDTILTTSKSYSYSNQKSIKDLQLKYYSIDDTLNDFV